MTIQEVEKIVSKKLGLDFNIPAELDMSDREKLYDAEADYILANPTLFNANQTAWANKRKGGGFYGVPVTGYSIGDAVTDFSGEVARQAVDINDTLNPFSESNRKTFYWLLVGGVAIYFLAPVIIQAVSSAKSPANVATK